MIRKVECFICGKEESGKYKCPTCFIKYCSVNCFKVHQEQDCANKKNEEQKEEDKINQEDKTRTVETEGKNKVGSNLNENCEQNGGKILSTSTLKQLEQNELLLTTLRNHEHLRTVLKHIQDQKTNDDRIIALKQARMDVPEFPQFIDLLLSLVDH